MIPSGVDSIEVFAFNGCSNLAAIKVDSGNNVYKTVEGLLCKDDGATLFRYPEGKGSSFTALDEVTAVDNYAFNGCTSLVSVNMSNVTSISRGAFYGCTSLASVSMPEVTSIGSSAFYGCTSLASVDMPKVTSIGEGTFRDCTSLKHISLPKVTSIGPYAFRDCFNLKSATFEKNPFTNLVNREWDMKEAKLNVIYIDAADVTIPDTANLIDKIIVLTEKAVNFKFTDGSGTEGVPGGIYKYNGTTWEKGKGLVSLPKLIYLYDGLVKRLNGDGYKIESGTSEATNAGKYEASLALVDSTYWWSDGDTAGSKTVKWEITPMAIDKLSISVEDQIYTGSPLEPDVTVMHGNKKLVKDTDYILSYENNTKVGTATVTIDGKGNYDGQAQINFNIVSTPGTDPGTDPEAPEPGTSPSSGGFPVAVVAVGVFAYFMFLRPKP